MPNSQADILFQDDLRVTDIPRFSMSVPCVEVLSAVTGESLAVFEKEEFADDASVKALKRCLAQQIGVTRFQLRLLQDNCPLDDQSFALGVVQLVKLEFLPADAEQDREIMVACRQNNDTLLEWHLNQPRSPNFEDANDNANTPLLVAASKGSLKLNVCFYYLKQGQKRKKVKQMLE